MKGRGGSIVRNYFTLKRVVSYNNRRHYQPPENNFGNYFEGGGRRGGSLGRVDQKTGFEMSIHDMANRWTPKD